MKKYEKLKHVTTVKNSLLYIAIMIQKKNGEERKKRAKTIGVLKRICTDSIRSAKIADYGIAGILFLIIVLSIIFTFKNGITQGSMLEITTAKETFLFSLSTNRIINLNGPIGETIVQINNSTVDVLESPGRLQICVKAKPISRQSQWLACLPNRIFLKIKDTKKAEIDGLSF